MNTNRNTILHKKYQYEQFTRWAVGSDYIKGLILNNKTYRHVIRFVFHLAVFIALIEIVTYSFAYSIFCGSIFYPVYLYFQGLLISGFMIHAHELSHHHIKIRWLNDIVGIISGLFCSINYYSFQYAHQFHHKNIGNIDTPEAGAPVSHTGQKQIKYDDKLYKTMGVLFQFSKIMWFLASWPLFILYGDYNSWLLPFYNKASIKFRSLLVFLLFVAVNSTLFFMFPVQYVVLYLLPMLIGGNRILAITYMHHAHEDSIFFNQGHHNFFNVIMATTDRDFGPIVNFFMMNNGYHIAHHLNSQIAYYDLKKASEFLRETIPNELNYNFYRCHFYRAFIHNAYEQRLEQDFEIYQLTFLNQGTHSYNKSRISKCFTTILSYLAGVLPEAWPQSRSPHLQKK